MKELGRLRHSVELVPTSTLSMPDQVSGTTDPNRKLIIINRGLLQTTPPYLSSVHSRVPVWGEDDGQLPKFRPSAVSVDRGEI